MNRLARISLVFVAAMLALTLFPASAQDTGEEGLLDDLGQLEGIEAAINRMYYIDYEAIMSVTPEDPAEDPFANLEGPILVLMIVMQFDSDDHAEDAFNLFRDEGSESLVADIESDTIELNEEAIDDLGDRAFRFDAIDADSETGGYYRYSFAQDGEYVLSAMTVAATEEGIANNDSLLEYLVNDGEKSDDDEEFNAEGGSAGGLWCFLPDDDHDAFGDLIPAGDQIVYPVPDEG